MTPTGPKGLPVGASHQMPENSWEHIFKCNESF